MFRQLNIRNKLALVLWGAAFLAFLIGLGALMLFNRLTVEERARRAMEPYAELVSVGANAAVAFEDPVRAQEILDSLRANPHIVEAEIRLEGGRVLAHYGRSGNPGPRPEHPERPDGNPITIAHGNALLVQALDHGGQLALTMSLDQINRQTRLVYWMGAIAMFVLLAITFGQLSVLQRTIIRPSRGSPKPPSVSEPIASTAPNWMRPGQMRSRVWPTASKPWWWRSGSGKTSCAASRSCNEPSWTTPPTPSSPRRPPARSAA